MVRWNVVTRDDLLTWADADGAPGQLPELVRRLIHETARESVDTLDFPGGSSVTSGGFDGFARSSRAPPFVPAGPSVWELSVRKHAPKKADEDIAKRDSVPDGSPLDQTTYVQVIVRAWTKAADWARDWAAKTAWKRVEGYNVDRVATWVEQAPATRIWLLERIGKPTVGVVSGSEWWHRWSTATDPVLTTEVVLARGIGDLRPALDRAGITTVGGTLGVNEIVACIVAAATEADLLDRVVMVDDRSAWQRLLKEPSPLLLIATDADFADDVSPDVQHTVVVPVPHGEYADVVLEPTDGEHVAEALRSLIDKSSYELGALARRSFVSFRRRIARRPELMTPPWAVGAIPRPVRAALLVVEWSDANKADRDIIAESGSDPEQVIAASYLRRCGWTGGLEWARQLLAAHPHLRPATHAKILHDANAVPEEWEEAGARGPAVEREYWLRYGYTGRGHDFPHVLTAADRMMDVGRSAAALDMLSMYQRNSEVDAAYAAAVARALEGCSRPPTRRSGFWTPGTTNAPSPCSTHTSTPSGCRE